MTIQAEFERLDILEKIRMVQDLWDQIATTPENVPVPRWHKEELDKRERERSKNGDQSEPWTVVEKRLRASL